MTFWALRSFAMVGKWAGERRVAQQPDGRAQSSGAEGGKRSQSGSLGRDAMERAGWRGRAGPSSEDGRRYSADARPNRDGRTGAQGGIRRPAPGLDSGSGPQLHKARASLSRGCGQRPQPLSLARCDDRIRWRAPPNLATRRSAGLHGITIFVASAPWFLLPQP